MAFVQADLLAVSLSSLRQAQKRAKTDAIKDAPRRKGKPVGVRVSMMNIYCPACHISSPREMRELTVIKPICTVCGSRLNSEAVETALDRYIEPPEATNWSFGREPALAPNAVAKAPGISEG